MSDEFDYEGGDGEEYGDAKTKVVANQPHDEEVALSDDEDGSLASSAEGESPMGKAPGRGDSPPNIMDNDDEGGTSEYDDREIPGSSGGGSRDGGFGGTGRGITGGSKDGDDPSEGSEGESEGDMEDKGQHGMAEGGYDAKDYEHLGVSGEISELFQYINRYKPHNHQLDTKLKPFIPDYIPAVGDIDEFIKVSKQAGMKPMAVSAVENAEKDPKRIDGWIKSINDLHKNKPPPTVSYQKSMPDIEALMQEWPPEMEAMLKSMPMFTADIKMDIKTFVKMCCSLLDIPVYNNPVESLHVLFTLLLEFRENPYFNPAGSNSMASPGIAPAMMM